MLDIKFICDNPEVVKENIKNKFKDSKLPLVDEVISLYNEKCAANTRANDLRANRNKVSKQIGMLMGQGKREEAEEMKRLVNEQAAELNALEEMGYLTHLHTSSGRVPTKEGYEKYINELMNERKLTRKEREVIQSNFANKLLNIRDIIECSEKTISKATNYASVVYSGPSLNAVIKDIKLYPVSKTTQLVVVVTNEKVINELANLGTNDEEELKAASDILKELFTDKPLALMKNREFRESVVTSELKKYKEVFDKVLDVIQASENNISDNMMISGRENLMEYPEFNDIEKLKKTVSALEKHESILPIITANGDLELSISIGNDDTGLSDCSIVTVSCNVGGVSKITAGVIGPMRMDYPKAISVLKEVAETIENVLGEDE